MRAKHGWRLRPSVSACALSVLLPVLAVGAKSVPGGLGFGGHRSNGAGSPWGQCAAGLRVARGGIGRARGERLALKGGSSSESSRDAGGGGGGGFGSSCLVTFQVSVAPDEIFPGDVLKVLGSHPALGGWEISKGVVLREGVGGTARGQHAKGIFTAQIALPGACDGDGYHVSYKYVVVAADGEVHWETALQHDRQVRIAGGQATTFDMLNVPNDDADRVLAAQADGLGGDGDGGAGGWVGGAGWGDGIATVEQVTARSPAALGGLRPGDVLLTVGSLTKAHRTVTRSVRSWATLVCAC